MTTAHFARRHKGIATPVPLLAKSDCAIDGHTLPSNQCVFVILQIPKSAQTVRPFAFVLASMGSLKTNCVAHEVPKTLYENLLVKHATIYVGGGNDGLRNACAFVRGRMGRVLAAG